MTVTKRKKETSQKQIESKEIVEFFWKKKGDTSMVLAVRPAGRLAVLSGRQSL